MNSIADWYLFPESTTSASWQKFYKNQTKVNMLEQDLKFCAYFAPLAGEALSELFQASFYQENYMAVANSGLMCKTPPRIEDLMYKEMQSQDYFCPVNETAINFPDWNPKYYSVLCRPWYKN